MLSLSLSLLAGAFPSLGPTPSSDRKLLHNDKHMEFNLDCPEVDPTGAFVPCATEVLAEINDENFVAHVEAGDVAEWYCDIAQRNIDCAQSDCKVARCTDMQAQVTASMFIARYAVSTQTPAGKACGEDQSCVQDVQYTLPLYLCMLVGEGCGATVSFDMHDSTGGSREAGILAAVQCMDDRAFSALMAEGAIANWAAAGTIAQNYCAAFQEATQCVIEHAPDSWGQGEDSIMAGVQAALNKAMENMPSIQSGMFDGPAGAEVITCPLPRGPSQADILGSESSKDSGAAVGSLAIAVASVLA